MRSEISGWLFAVVLWAYGSGLSPVSVSRLWTGLGYGHAAQTYKGAKETFGKGDVRGVIALESSKSFGPRVSCLIKRVCYRI